LHSSKEKRQAPNRPSGRSDPENSGSSSSTPQSLQAKGGCKDIEYHVTITMRIDTAYKYQACASTQHTSTRHAHRHSIQVPGMRIDTAYKYQACACRCLLMHMHFPSHNPFLTSCSLVACPTGSTSNQPVQCP
jgi:hypothetical protein